MLRTFIAISVPCPPPLARVLKELAACGPAIKASSPRSLHCTLKFLGDTSEETAAALGPALESVVCGRATFSARLGGIGAFPGAERPSVVWAGLDAPELGALQGAIEGLSGQYGFVPEGRAFHPHVTLARIKQRPPAQLRSMLERYAMTEWGTFDVESVELIKSTPGPGGSQYSVLTRAMLAR